MADAKDKKAGPAPSTLTPFEHGVWYFFTALLFVSVIGTLFDSSAGGVSSTASAWWHAFVRFILIHIFPIAFVLAFILSILFLIGIIASLRQLALANEAMNAFYNPPVKAAEGDLALLNEPKNKQWERVVNHLNSNNPNDWKFAIIEADIMLSDLLETLHFEGDTIAEKLKQAEGGSFQNLENAWEAHKVRNQIAHEGADFVLSEREARRVIELYKKVFVEYKVI